VLDVLSSGKGVHLGLVVEGEGGRLGLVLVVICLRLHTSATEVCVFSFRFFLREKVGREYSETSTVTGFRARHARIGHHCCF
jgi:hypothetical protein